MDRELVLGVLFLLVVGVALWSGALWGTEERDGATTFSVERLCWVAVWKPLLPAAFASAALVGWALCEPERAEAVPDWMLLAALPFVIVWARAASRAFQSLVIPAGEVVAATIGLLWPSIVIAPRFAESVDEAVLAAAREHESAHARHRDPLRLWVAQLATDLQWPWPSAGKRLQRWRRALEWARDDEARLRGIDGPDLAAAIVTAARLLQASQRGAGASLAADPAMLRERVERLLDSPSPAADGVPLRLLPLAAIAGSVGLALLFGVFCGEAAVRALLLVWT